MWKNNKIKLLIFLSILIIFGFFYFINSIIGKDVFTNLKSSLSNDQKKIIKTYIFPHKILSLQQQIITEQQIKIDIQHQFLKSLNLPQLELDFKKTNNDIQTIKKIFKLSNNMTLEKYHLENGFFYGTHNLFPGTGYIDFYDSKLFVLSSRGILGYLKNIDNKHIIKQIKNNINDFINLKQFKKSNKFSLKDILMHKDKVFISYTEEIQKECWNTSIIYGNLNYDNMIFKKLFSSKKCIQSSDNIDKEFSASASGGKIVAFDNNNILLAIGDYRNEQLAQNMESVNGKIIKIDIFSRNYEIISMGHRKPQGLYFDKKNNFILETEPGPGSIDEINLIEVKKINKEKIPNYGWAIISAGKIYKPKNVNDKKDFQIKSYNVDDFIEPLKSFVPAIGISEIVKVGKNEYVVSSMKDKSLYFFKYREKKKITDLKRVEVFDRVRDLRFSNNKLYLFLENTASIGIINLN